MRFRESQALDGLTVDTAYEFVLAALHVNKVLEIRDYSHSDFTSLMTANVDENNHDWARFIGGSWAFFANNGQDGVRMSTQDVFTLLSQKADIRVAWCTGGAGGSPAKTGKIVEDYFGSIYNVSKCLQEAFGGPRSRDWQDEEVAKRFINWSKTIEEITDVVPLVKFTETQQLKDFLTVITGEAEEGKPVREIAQEFTGSNNWYVKDIFTSETFMCLDIERPLFRDPYRIRICFKDLSSNWLVYDAEKYVWKVESNESGSRYGYKQLYYTNEELVDLCSKIKIVAGTFDAATFRSLNNI